MRLVCKAEGRVLGKVCGAKNRRSRARQSQRYERGVGPKWDGCKIRSGTVSYSSAERNRLYITSLG